MATHTYIPHPPIIERQSESCTQDTPAHRTILLLNTLDIPSACSAPISLGGGSSGDIARALAIGCTPESCLFFAPGIRRIALTQAASVMAASCQELSKKRTRMAFST